MRRQIQTLTLMTLAVTALFFQATSVHAENRTRKVSSRPIPNPKFDPNAEKVEFFDAMEAGQLETKVIAMGAEHGKLLITNTTDAPLSLQPPHAFVIVKVLKQFGQQGGGFGGGGQQGGGLGGQQGGGGQQNAGGGAGGHQGGGLGGGGLGGGGQQGGGGGGFFSIPPEKTVSIKYVSACLNHGKADPTPTANYEIVKVEDYTQDPILAELIAMVGTGRLAPQAAQAAIWNRTDNMSWNELAQKFSYDVLRNRVPYFNRNDLQGAQLLTAAAVGRIRERNEQESVVKTTPTEPEVPSRVR